MTALQVLIRPARDSDREAISHFTQATFSWGDYIGEVFDEWARDSKGVFFVAEVQERAIGCLHVTIQSETEAWHEGMRIAPEFRRQRVASRLDAAGRDVARSYGCRVVRLATGLNNLVAQKTLSAEGYRPLFLYHTFTAILPLAGESPDPGPTSFAADAHGVFEQWSESEECRLTGGIAMLDNWRWGTLTPEWVSRLATQGRIRKTGSAFWRTEGGDGEEEYTAATIVAGPRDPAATVKAICRDAFLRGSKKIELFTPSESGLPAVLPACGFESNGGLYIYQYDL